MNQNDRPALRPIPTLRTNTAGGSTARSTRKNFPTLARSPRFAFHPMSGNPLDEAHSLLAQLRGGWQRVPTRRSEIGGDREEYLPLQWCATSDTLDRHLSLAGWQRATPWSPATTLRWLLPQAPADALPVLWPCV